MKKDYTGDGLSFYNMVSVSKLKKIDIQTSMGIKSTSTFFGLYGKHDFTDKEKSAAAGALGKSVEEIFGVNDNLENSSGKTKNIDVHTLDSQSTKNISTMSDQQFIRHMYERLMSVHENLVAKIEGPVRLAEDERTQGKERTA